MGRWQSQGSDSCNMIDASFGLSKNFQVKIWPMGKIWLFLNVTLTDSQLPAHHYQHNNVNPPVVNFVNTNAYHRPPAEGNMTFESFGFQVSSFFLCVQFWTTNILLFIYFTNNDISHCTTNDGPPLVVTTTTCRPRQMMFKSFGSR